MAPVSMSEAETRLFNQVCEALQVSSDDQKGILRSLTRDELNDEWTSLISLMEANGPLSMLSEDELKYLSALHSAQNSRQTQTQNTFSQSSPAASQRTVDHGLVNTATHDIFQYNNALEKLLSKYRDYVRRSIANLQQPSATKNEPSTIEQKIAALSRRKEMLRAEIHGLNDKISNHTKQLDGVRTEPGLTDSNDYLKQVSETLPSYDHILSRLNVLSGELDHGTFEDDTIIQTARRHASQIVLSLATKCRASLDTIFVEASSNTSKRRPHISDPSRAVGEERDAVYAEIQSLWDEMVPLAHMVVEKEFLKPIMNKIEACSERQSGRDATVFLYTSSMLRFMNERLLLLADRLAMLACHHQILFKTLAQVNSKAEPAQIPSLGTTNSSLTQTNESNKPTGHRLLEVIQRQMELYGSIPMDTDKQPQTTQKLTAQMQAHKLDRYVISRQRKGDDLARNVHQSFERTAKSELTDAELGVHLLLDSIMADSDVNCQISGHIYEDQQVEDSVATMRSQAEEIQTIFRSLREDSGGAPVVASDFVTYAYNKAAKQRGQKGDEGPRPEGQEECGKFTALVNKWGDSSSLTN
ncbi:hypothetical protein F5Y04DRAFT_42394 [Hypomontagnella monticulosa]|nr:hypothetical protein F5Y04DRAFT_42394 [Hypomontagnella monticulosa]